MNCLQEFTRWLRRRKPKSIEVTTSVAIDKMVELKHVASFKHAQIVTEKQYEGDVTLAPKLQRIAKLTGVRVGGKYHALPEPITVRPYDHVLIVFGGPSMKDDNS